jgi:hypothetical protein
VKPLSKQKGMSMRPVVPLVCAILAFAVSSSAFAEGPNYNGWQKGPWQKHDRDEGITTYINEKAAQGSVEAVRADLIINAPADKIFPILIDPDRAKSYSFIAEFKVVGHYGDWGYLYQRVQTTGVKDRDFTVHLKMLEPKTANTGPYGWVWKEANEKGPKPVDGVVRAQGVQGSYFLTPLSSNQTLVSYRVYFDPDSWVPSFLINRAVRSSAFETVKRLRSDARKLGLLN